MEIINRVKALLINKHNKIMLCLCDGQYQFPGGHVEDGESLIDALKREIREETGIVLDIKNIKPFHKIHYDLKDRKLNIYYYVINCDEDVNLKNTDMTDLEKEGNFKIKYVDLGNAEKVIIDNIDAHPRNRFIVKEMVEVLEAYKKI